MRVGKFILLGLVVLFSSEVFGQSKRNTTPGEVAFDGYDLVSYFDSPVPLKGSDDITFEYDGLKLSFSDTDNLNKFKSDPDKYLPSYGGWCATAMINNNFVIPSYSMYKIQDGELLFFQVKAFFNAYTHWEKKPEKNKISADESYTKSFGE
ncbi:MAG: YHS domain protein [Cyclobacteriaceae bacterium]